MCTNFIVFFQVEKEIVDIFTNFIVFLQVETCTNFKLFLQMEK